MSSLMEAVVTILLGITGVAFLAVLVSKNSQTPQVIQATASGYGNDLAVAISPVTGSSIQSVLGYPNNNGPMYS